MLPSAMGRGVVEEMDPSLHSSCTAREMQAMSRVTPEKILTGDKENILIKKLVKHRNGLPGAVVEPPFVEMLSA